MNHCTVPHENRINQLFHRGHECIRLNDIYAGHSRHKEKDCKYDHNALLSFTKLALEGRLSTF